MFRSSTAPASPYHVQRVAPAFPFFVVMTMTPFAASVPYSVAADGPFTISMSSISFGSRSLRKLPCVPVKPKLNVFVRHPNAVDDVDRVVRDAAAVGGQRAEAADANDGRGAGHRAGKYRDARRLGDEEVGEVGDGRAFRRCSSRRRTW